MTVAPLLELRDLGVSIPSGRKNARADIIEDVSFEVAPGRIVGLIGESGSGKSMTAKSIIRMQPEACQISAGQILFRGKDLAKASQDEMQHLRGAEIAMVFQDPLAVLNPMKTIGWQIDEALIVHGTSRKAAREKTLKLLELVGIPDPKERAESYPHQFSGGMRQRVVIAIALANNAPLLLADEPTTALDVTIQKQILDLLVDLRDRLGVAILLITHDIGVVEEVCDDVVVMYGGMIVESGTAAQVLAAPRHPYTAALLQSMPRPQGERGARMPSIKGGPPDARSLPQGCRFEPRCPMAAETCRQLPPMRAAEGNALHLSRCWFETPDMTKMTAVAAQPRPRRAIGKDTILEVRDLKVNLGQRRGLLRPARPFYAVNGVSLEIGEGETLGLVGESGCGKSSLSRALVGLNPIESGTIRLAGRDVSDMSSGNLKFLRHTAQYIFQDPYASLNPRLTIRQTMQEAMAQGPTASERHDGRINELMELVGLSVRHLDRYPHEFSGGQRQRIGIARTLTVEPRLLICDEPVSALDISVQAQIINLLADMRDELGISLLFIAHDLAVVRHLSDRIAVMRQGKIVEQGQTDQIFSDPKHDYTRLLLSSIPGGHAAQKKAHHA
ncbi:dipeptide ABC transporter ATP-binding protein [Pseudooceanicola spongiae]|uniref:Dipeptide ABC transporter ATP-binding protein n=1 Tax=Pseudooceanicola spongiae TaxID=2613965 RepID=A0A7L9WU84_9RHOB|nr:ABC transporter ATP-binding protein [Pseudooceanicola spongiae]QOL83016.1 dipeptide ABC transporter ATP-binding protein [Pseudooceanicola spongiae]